MGARRFRDKKHSSGNIGVTILLVDGFPHFYLSY